MRTPILTDGRIVLRRWDDRDAARHIAALDRDDIARWIDFPRPLRKPDVLEFFARPTLHFGVFAPDDRTVLGGVGLDPVERERAWAEIDWWVSNDARRAGVGRAAVELLCRWAFAELGLQVIEARIQRPNEASQAFARACGFSPAEGVVRRERRGEEVELLRFERRAAA